MWGGWGNYNPNHQTSRLVEADVAWRTGQSGAPPDSVWCASHVTRPLGSDRGALTCGPAWLSGGAPDKSCRLSGVPPARALLFCARWRTFNALQTTVVLEVAVAPLSHRIVRCAPDSPVNYSEAPLRIPEGEVFSLKSPGAPDTVRWHTGQSGGTPDSPVRQTRVPLDCLLLSCLIPFLGLYINLL